MLVLSRRPRYLPSLATLSRNLISLPPTPQLTRLHNAWPIVQPGVHVPQCFGLRASLCVPGLSWMHGHWWKQVGRWTPVMDVTVDRALVSAVVLCHLDCLVKFS